MLNIYTDGSSRGNPGRGGFGVAVFDEGHLVTTMQDTAEETTNNRMELEAILTAFKYIEEEAPDVETIIWSDSAYCVNMCNSWIYGWAKNGWQNSKKETVKNLDLVKRLYNYLITNFSKCQICKVKGHDNILENELADALATGDKKKEEKVLSELKK